MVHMGFDFYSSSGDTTSLSVSNIRKYHCFVNFHKIVESVEDTWSDIRHQPPESNINIMFSCLGRLIENQCIPYIEISQQSSNSLKCKVRTLLNIYWLLVGAVHHANAFYCDQLMITTSYLFLSIVFNLFYAVLNYTSGDYIEFIGAFLWALAGVSYMVMMVRSADDVTKSADKTTMMICKMIHNHINPAMRIQLERFLLQVTKDITTF
ncbi:hypothetical protein J6590_083834 [Homalodisca vitripennis]|nr:hypothetical protein J6590_083834 [Homalodisca vitripennis]